VSTRLSYKQDRARRIEEMRQLQIELERIREIVQGDKLATWIKGGPIFGNVYSEVLLDCILKEASEIQKFYRRESHGYDCKLLLPYRTMGECTQ
jgi:hypothetical protein